jgi:hypothetical protein
VKLMNYLLAGGRVAKGGYSQGFSTNGKRFPLLMNV